MRRQRTILLVAFALIALVVPASALSYHIVTYFGPSAHANWNFDYASGSTSMAVNRVYRPTPKTFALFYGTGQQYEENRFSNPFIHDNAGGYTNSHCADVDDLDHGGTNNVTCQYKRHHP
jgi:hypothetical protein